MAMETLHLPGIKCPSPGPGMAPLLALAKPLGEVSKAGLGIAPGDHGIYS